MKALNLATNYKEIDALFDALDIDKSGEIELDEFRVALNKLQARVAVEAANCVAAV